MSDAKKAALEASRAESRRKTNVAAGGTAQVINLDDKMARNLKLLAFGVGIIGVMWLLKKKGAL